MTEVDFSTWVAGWSALGFVLLFGALVMTTALRARAARLSIPYRILVTGTRGKSGTVRLIHAALAPHRRTFAKITGTTAKELLPDGVEIPTVRFGAATACEMITSLQRAHKHGAEVGVFECMAVTPSMIHLVQHSHVQATTVVIPSIRLDHLEEEGLTEEEIALSILTSVDNAELIITGVTQPSVLRLYDEYCAERGIQLDVVTPDHSTPVIPGHHPTNVAIALHIATTMGISFEEAVEGLQQVSMEPRALESWVYTCTDSTTLVLIDIGGANDPESAWEALTQWGLHGSEVVPILVNRWERPLRSVSFFSSVRGHFRVIGISGTLMRWITRRHSLPEFKDSRVHNESRFFLLTRKLSRNLEALHAELSALGVTGPRQVVVLIENTHESTADILRRTFETQATLVPLTRWAEKR